MSRVRTSSIEDLFVDQFVDAVRSAIYIEPDWSSGPMPMLSRNRKDDVETAEFADSSYMSRATYHLKASDLRITLRNGRRLRIAPIPVEYWDELLIAPSKGTFFVKVIGPRFKVERLGWFDKVYSRFVLRPK